MDSIIVGWEVWGWYEWGETSDGLGGLLSLDVALWGSSHIQAYEVWEGNFERLDSVARQDKVLGISLRLILIRLPDCKSRDILCI